MHHLFFSLDRFQFSICYCIFDFVIVIFYVSDWFYMYQYNFLFGI